MRWIAEMFISHILGYIVYLCFEAPFNNLTKKLFTKKTAAQRKPVGATADKPKMADKTDVNENIPHKNGHKKVN